MPCRADNPSPSSDLSNIFISYSQEDQDFVRALAEAFKRRGRAIWLDRKDIARTGERELELLSRIEAADNFVVVISPESVASGDITKELAHAVNCGKKLVPIVLGDVAATRMPQTLVSLEPIRLRSEDDISSAFRALTKRIDADLRFDLFISYSRKDEQFVRKLEEALHTAGRRFWIDRRNIRYTEEWLKAIYSGIEAADNFAFVISPDSVSSENCCRELSHAIEQNKRLIPVIHREIDPHSVPQPLADLDWVPFSYTDDFNSAFNGLLGAIDIDLDYVRAHTRLLVRAIEWDKAGRDKSLLLRGANLREAERWLADSAQKPRATTLQSQYITVSRQDANRRQRMTVSALTAGLIVAVVLTLLSLYQYKIAGAQRNEAKQRLAALYEEQGRQELIGGHPMQALIYLNEALQEGGDTPALRFMLTQALHSLDGQVAILDGHTQGVAAIAATGDGQRVVTGSDDGTAKVWDAASGKALLTLEAHEGGVKSVAFSPDEGEILTAGADHTARVWNARSGELRATLTRHEDTVNSASFSHDGRHIVTASNDGTAILWEAKSGRFIARLGGQYWPITMALFSPDDRLLLTATADAASLNAFTYDAPTFMLWTNDEPTILIWDVHDMQKVKARVILRDEHHGSVTGTFSPDGQSIVTGGYFDRMAAVWDTRSGRRRLDLTDDGRTHGGPISSAAFSHDGKLILTASWDGIAKVWDAATGGRRFTLKGHTAKVNSAAFSEDDKYIVTAGESGATEVWDTNEGRLLATLGGHTNAVAAAVFARSGEYVVTAGADKRAIVWDWKSARTTAPVPLSWYRLEVFGDEIGRLAVFSPDSRLVVTSSWKGNAKVWRAADGQLLTTLHDDTVAGADISAEGAVFSPDGERVLTVSTSGVVRMWEAASGKLAYTLEGRDGKSSAAAFDKAVGTVAFDLGGRRIVTAEGDMTSKIWDAQTGAQLLTLRGHEGAVNSAAFSSDGARVITASDDGTSKLWDAANGALLKTFAASVNSGVSAATAAFSHDGRRILTTSGDKIAILWDADSGKLLATLGGRTGNVTSASFSPDGSRIVTASLDSKARIWDGRSGSLLFTLEGHTGPVKFALFGADGLLVATAGHDKTVRIWDAQGGRGLATLTGHANLIESMAFSPNNTRLVTASKDDTVLIWDVHLETRSPDEINMLVKRHVPLGVEGGRLLPVTSPEGMRR